MIAIPVVEHLEERRAVVGDLLPPQSADRLHRGKIRRSQSGEIPQHRVGRDDVRRLGLGFREFAASCSQRLEEIAIDTFEVVGIAAAGRRS